MKSDNVGVHFVTHPCVFSLIFCLFVFVGFLFFLRFFFIVLSLCVCFSFRLELEKYDARDLIKGGIAFQRAANIDSHQYDLNASIQTVNEGDDSEVHSFVCEYKISRVGYYCMFVRLGKYHIRGSPFFDLQGKPGATHAKSSVAYGPGLVVAHPHQLNTFTIEGRDRLGNARSDSENPDGDDFIVGTMGPAIVEGKHNPWVSVWLPMFFYFFITICSFLFWHHLTPVHRGND